MHSNVGIPVKNNHILAEDIKTFALLINFWLCTFQLLPKYVDPKGDHKIYLRHNQIVTNKAKALKLVPMKKRLMLNLSARSHRAISKSWKFLWSSRSHSNLLQCTRGSTTDTSCKRCQQMLGAGLLCMELIQREGPRPAFKWGRKSWCGSRASPVMRESWGPPIAHDLRQNCPRPLSAPSVL